MECVIHPYCITDYSKDTESVDTTTHLFIKKKSKIGFVAFLLLRSFVFKYIIKLHKDLIEFSSIFLKCIKCTWSCNTLFRIFKNQKKTIFKHFVPQIDFSIMQGVSNCIVFVIMKPKSVEFTTIKQKTIFDK